MNLTKAWTVWFVGFTFTLVFLTIGIIVWEGVTLTTKFVALAFVSFFAMFGYSFLFVDWSV